ncbi:MAG: polyphosphate kinase 1 [Cytophagales bacterium]|nr:polyphosphate kinase 1 [Armatimonadota bacterium]
MTSLTSVSLRSRGRKGGETPTAPQVPTEQNQVGDHSESLTPAAAANPSLYINRELSWLEFNKRVLEEAWEDRHPLLERAKFLGIFGSNLDEFFMIRVSALQVQRAEGVADVAVDGLTPTEALIRVGRRVDELMSDVRACWHQLHLQLRREGIEVLRYDHLSAAEKQFLADYFENEIFPILTPLAVDPGHPFPHISNLSLNMAVVIRDPVNGEQQFARMKVPGVLPRLVACPPMPSEENGNGLAAPPVKSRRVPQRFVWLEDVIGHHVGRLFPGMDPVAVYPFRVTRNADIEIQEDEAEDLLRTIQQNIRDRHFGFVTRLEISPEMPERIRTLLIDNLEMDARNVVVSEMVMGHSSLLELTKLDRPDLKDAPLVPRTPGILSRGEDIFSLLSRQDILLQHPYDSFTPVIHLVEAAAKDPHVRAIKQSLYRLGPNSPIVSALIAARDADTQVATLVELKARFDEENNITWARALEQAGVHVVYGLIGLKTHCKVLLIVRREPGGIKRYLHLGTGNYNAVTARIYTDFSLMTSDPDLGADATDLFNYLTGYSRQTRFRKMLVAPINLRQRMAQMIAREAEHALNGRPARLIFKMNALVDPEMIDLLYSASQAGVRVDLLIRGICCLRPGIKDISDNISVTSVVGRFLEHARAYYFENGGIPELYLGSADLMTRNLDRRVEVLFPVEDPTLRQHVVRDTLLVELADNVQARRLLPAGTWERVRPEPGRRRRVDSQAIFLRGDKSPRRR